MDKEEVQEEAEVQPEDAEDKPVESEHTEVEQLAMKLGWNPNHEGGDREFVSAEKFILKSREIQDTQNKQNKSLQKQVDTLERELKQGINALQKHNRDVYQVQVKNLKRQLGELQTTRKEAVEDGDMAAVNQIDQQIAEINKIPDDLPSNDLDISPPGFSEWREKNPWYKSDPEMTQYADFQGENHPELKGLPFTKMLEGVERLVRKQFPEKFKDEKPADTPKQSAPAVEGGGQRTTRKSPKGKYTYNDLSREQQETCDFFVKRGVMTQEDYIKQLTDIEAQRLG